MSSGCGERTYGGGWWFCRRRSLPGGRCCSRRAGVELHVAKEPISSAVVEGVSRTRRLAAAEVLLVGAVGDEIRAPTILVLNDGESEVQVGAVAVTTAITLIDTVD